MNANRVPNDALRVSSIMMEDKYRGQMVKVMSNVKDKAGLDMPTSPETAMYEDMVVDFNNIKYTAKVPEKANLIEWTHGPLDPNDVSTMCLVDVPFPVQVNNLSLTILVSCIGRNHA